MTEPTADDPVPQDVASPTGWTPPEPERPIEPGTAAGVSYATLGTRVIAIVIDMILVGFIYAVVVAVLVAMGWWKAFLVGGLIHLILSVGYFVYLWTRQRATLGQMLLGIETVNADDGATLTRNQALRRWVFLVGPGALAQLFGYGAGTVLGYIAWIVVVLAGAYEIYLLYSASQSPTRQGFHDVQAATVVVKRAG